MFFFIRRVLHDSRDEREYIATKPPSDEGGVRHSLTEGVNRATGAKIYRIPTDVPRNRYNDVSLPQSSSATAPSFEGANQNTAYSAPQKGMLRCALHDSMDERECIVTSLPQMREVSGIA